MDQFLDKSLPASFENILQEQLSFTVIPLEHLGAIIISQPHFFFILFTTFYKIYFGFIKFISKYKLHLINWIAVSTRRQILSLHGFPVTNLNSSYF